MGPKVWWHRFAKVVRDTGTKVAPHLSKVTSKVTTPAPSVTILIPAVQSSLPKSHKASKCYTTLLTQLAHESGTQAKPPAEASTAGEASVGARCLCVRGEGVEAGRKPFHHRRTWLGWPPACHDKELELRVLEEVHLFPLPPFYQNKSRPLKVHNFLDLYCLHWQGHGLRMSVHEQDETTRTLSHPPSPNRVGGGKGGKGRGRGGGVVGNQATKSRCGPHSLSTLEK